MSAKIPIPIPIKTATSIVMIYTSGDASAESRGEGKKEARGEDGDDCPCFFALDGAIINSIGYFISKRGRYLLTYSTVSILIFFIFIARVRALLVDNLQYF